MFADGGPVLIVRAHIDDAMLTDFRRWFRSIQLPHMLEVPGVIEARPMSVPKQHNLNWMVIYHFAPGSEVQAALQSEEARLARDDWTAWSRYVRDISFEVYASLAPLPALHHWN